MLLPSNLKQLSPRLGNAAISSWSNIRLAELKEQQKQVASQSKTSYIPEASSGLKIEGEKTLSKI
jgi:hypothetical protein